MRRLIAYPGALPQDIGYAPAMNRRGHGSEPAMEPGWYPDPDRPGIEIYWDGDDFPEDVPPRVASARSAFLTRLALAIGALLALGAIAVTLAPTSPTAAGDSGCGTWLSPGYDRAEVAELFDTAVDLDQKVSQLGGDTSELQASTLAVVRAYEACDKALDTRRTVALSMLGLAVVLPMAVLFVGGRRDG